MKRSKRDMELESKQSYFTSPPSVKEGTAAKVFY